MEFVMKKANESGTPAVSLFSPNEILALAKESGFKKTEYVPAKDVFNLYPAKRFDGLNAGDAEAFLVASSG